MRPDGKIQNKVFSPRYVVLALREAKNAKYSERRHIQGRPSLPQLIVSEATAPKSSGREVVVGSCNSAHSNAQKFAEQDYDVTIV
jgi:hypothetical protein